MRVIKAFKVSVVLSITVLASSYVSAQEKLSICLDQDSAPYSYKYKGTARGFDLDLAKKIADEMDRELNVIWFEGENEKESSDALDANALLSKGLCDLVGGYALFEGSLGEPSIEKARLPDIDGEKRSKEWVHLGSLMASTPYVNSPFTVLVNKKSGINLSIDKLSKLKGYNLAGLHGTLPHLLLMSHKNGYLADDMNNLRWVDDIYGRLNSGDFDAILTELHKYEYYESVNNPDGISKTKYYHPLSFNIGFVTLKEKVSLLREVNMHINKIIQSGEIASISANNHMTYIKPSTPSLLTRDTLMNFLTKG
jgi:ABC-type amino acid transport substrate-binding protein